MGSWSFQLSVISYRKHSAVSYQLSALLPLKYKVEKSNFIKASEYESLVENVVEIK
ncbi:MAG: hypothetical protein F6K39_23300 [Okeania sp. SIO3B3]|nr:hypothetical protein [Okeania sp. SIO3B3]